MKNPSSLLLLTILSACGKHAASSSEQNNRLRGSLATTANEPTDPALILGINALNSAMDEEGRRQRPALLAKGASSAPAVTNDCPQGGLHFYLGYNTNGPTEEGNIWTLSHIATKNDKSREDSRDVTSIMGTLKPLCLKDGTYSFMMRDDEGEDVGMQYADKSSTATFRCMGGTGDPSLRYTILDYLIENSLGRTLKDHLKAAIPFLEERSNVVTDVHFVVDFEARTWHGIFEPATADEGAPDSAMRERAKSCLLDLIEYISTMEDEETSEY